MAKLGTGRSLLTSPSGGCPTRGVRLREWQLPPLGAPGEPPKPSEGAETQPDLFTAIQQQLGLKLESTRAETDVLVIDKVEKPSEN